MPMIDVYGPNDLLPAGSDRRIGEELTLAVLRAEGVSSPTRIDARNPLMTSTALSVGSASASIIHLRVPSTASGNVAAPAPTMRLRKEFWPRKRSEEHRRRSDVKPNGVDRREPERVERLRDELAHCLRREKVVTRSALRQITDHDRA